MKTHLMKPDYLILAAAMLALLGVGLLAALLTAPAVSAEQAAPGLPGSDRGTAQPPEPSPSQTGAPPITLTANLSRVDECGCEVSITVTGTLSAAASEDLDVVLSAGGGTASSADYTATPKTFTIPSGQISAQTTVQYTIVNDDDPEGDETFVISDRTDNWIFITPVTITIADNDPEIQLAIVGRNVVAENDGATVINVRADLKHANASNNPITVSLTLGGTAANPDDYTASTLSSITIPQGVGSASASINFTLTPVADSLLEGDETITISGTTTATAKNTVEPAANPDRTLRVAPVSITVEDDTTVATVGCSPTDITLSVRSGYPGKLREAASGGFHVAGTRAGTDGAVSITLSLGGTATRTRTTPSAATCPR